MQRTLYLIVCLTLAASSAAAQQRSAVQGPADVKPMSISLEDVSYPHPVHYLPLTLYGHDVRMAYMDVPAVNQPNGHTVVLLHGTRRRQRRPQLSAISQARPTGYGDTRGTTATPFIKTTI